MGLSRFRLYANGDVQFTDSRIRRPVTFAHVADLHLPPYPRDGWPQKYSGAIDWWNTNSRDPHASLPALLDQIRDRKVDFVFFGGDILDCYDSGTAERLINLCRERNLKAYFQIGNHDWEDNPIRYITHEYDGALRMKNSERLMRQWEMPGLYYSFEINGLRFISLDTQYIKRGPDYSALFSDEQTGWFLEQLSFDGPVVVFHHVPFNRPTLEHRLRAVWSGILACITEDNNGTKVKKALETSQNILGTFVAHAHIRSEDPMGAAWQFMTAAGYGGSWRYVKVGDSAPPKSLVVDGEPVVK